MAEAVMAIDPGTKRAGIAISDPGGTFALPLDVFPGYDDDGFVGGLIRFAHKREVGEIVVGLPKRLDGSEGAEAVRARELAATLHDRLRVPVHLVDERLTTRQAESALWSAGVSARRQRRRVDSVAAAVLLQSFLDSRVRR